MARPDPQLKIRVPADVKEWLEARAGRTLRSVNNEVLFILQGERDRETKTVGEPVKATPTV